MYIVYALYNQKHDKIYIGQTKDLSERLLQHKTGYFGGYTAGFDGEWIVIYLEEVKDRPRALKREKQLKSYRGREFIRKQIPNIPR